MKFSKKVVKVVVLGAIFSIAANVNVFSVERKEKEMVTIGQISFVVYGPGEVAEDTVLFRMFLTGVLKNEERRFKAETDFETENLTLFEKVGEKWVQIAKITDRLAELETYIPAEAESLLRHIEAFETCSYSVDNFMQVSTLAMGKYGDYILAELFKLPKPE